ncbi:MAG: hypothetical protein IPP73_18400 [Chitinophagaceae bacterium]|nr:hypothetical protein [Chitinophagaceae bacterium]
MKVSNKYLNILYALILAGIFYTAIHFLIKDRFFNYLFVYVVFVLIIMPVGLGAFILRLRNSITNRSGFFYLLIAVLNASIGGSMLYALAPYKNAEMSLLMPALFGTISGVYILLDTLIVKTSKSHF